MKIIQLIVESYVDTLGELQERQRIEICRLSPCGHAATLTESLATIQWSSRSGEINNLFGSGELLDQEVEAKFPELLRMMTEARSHGPQVDRRDPTTKRCVLQDSDLRVRVWERPWTKEGLETKAERKEALLSA